jgi:toxin YoeB
MPASGPASRLRVVDKQCREDLENWAREKPAVAARALEIMGHLMRDPFTGLGKPEPLKGFPNTWSRRLTQEHRLVYVVFDDRVVFLQARLHYV